MTTEFLAESAQKIAQLFAAMDIPSAAAGMVASEWSRWAVSEWGGEWTYIGKTTSEARRERSRRDRAIVALWQKGESQAYIARKFGISRGRVNRIVRRADE